MWPCHVILLVITSNNISLSPPISITYHFDTDGSLFLIYQTSFIYYWELFFLYRIIEKRTSCYLIDWEAYHLSSNFVGTYFSFSFAFVLQLLSSWFYNDYKLI